MIENEVRREALRKGVLTAPRRWDLVRWTNSRGKGPASAVQNQQTHKQSNEISNA
jgi:hypothetical protein